MSRVETLSPERRVSELLLRLHVRTIRSIQLRLQWLSSPFLHLRSEEPPIVQLAPHEDPKDSRLINPKNHALKSALYLRLKKRKVLKMSSGLIKKVLKHPKGAFRARKTLQKLG